MKKTNLLYLFTCVSSLLIAQSTWKTLPNSPFGGRHDDIFFKDSLRGWTVSGFGRFHKTIDGGQSWLNTYNFPSSYLRSVEFLNDDIGYIGSLDGLFLRTVDGGETWTNLAPANFPGICGISIVDSLYAYAVGIWSSPGYVMKSTNGGTQWSTTPLGEAMVDVYFISRDTGFVSGKSSTGAAIWYTTDGGANWTKKFDSGVPGQYVWKMMRITEKDYVGSVQTFNGGVFVKSSDGGQTWTKKNAPVPDMQGIGFVTPEHGWVGGYVDGLWETFDGGDTWTYLTVGGNYNRFHFINPSLGFASGNRIYKFSPETSSAEEPKNTLAHDGFDIKIAPNPSNGVFTVSYYVPVQDRIRIDILTASGASIRNVHNVTCTPGEYQFEVSADDLPAGTYMLGIQRNHGLYAKPWIKQ